MFTFQWPWLIFLLPIPFLVRAILPDRKAVRDGAPEVRFPHLSSLQNAFGIGSSDINDSKSLRWPWSLFAVWSLMVLALMRPQLVDKIASVKADGRDLMVAVDLSGSMQSLDFSVSGQRVNRLDVAKRVVKDFVQKRDGDRIGLVVFGEHAYLQSPLTLDRMAVSKMLDNNVPGMAGDSTAIGDAIGLAVKNLRERPAQSRAIVLLTDGEDNSSTLPPLQAAKLARQYGIRIYAIVIGKEGTVPFPDKNGEIVLVESHVDTVLTRQIAEMTGGKFYRSTDADSLAQIYDEIDSLQKSKSEVPPVLIRTPLFQYPMALALLLLGTLGIFTELKGESYVAI